MIGMTMSKNPSHAPITLSVVIPAFNAATWLPKSVPKVELAIKKASISKAEFIIIDDGSSDDTSKVANDLKLDFPVRVISQPNLGRFLARKKGVELAKYDYVLLIDTRIFIGEGSIKHVTDQLSTKKDRLIWTSHVVINKEGNMYARFWEALTFIAWRKYFSNPRDCSYGIKDFDHYPKGTTCFFVPKTIISEANNWFEGQTKSSKASNDDTLLIRRMAETHNINLSPKFYCTYHARTSLKQYNKHVYHRGKVFVDGFLRRDKNRFFWPLIAFLVASIVLPLILIIFPQYLYLIAICFGALWLLELLVALLLRVPTKDAISLFVLTPLFTAVYGAGIWTAVFDIYLRRHF